MSRKLAPSLRSTRRVERAKATQWRVPAGAGLIEFAFRVGFLSGSLLPKPAEGAEGEREFAGRVPSHGSDQWTADS